MSDTHATDRGGDRLRELFLQALDVDAVVEGGPCGGFVSTVDDGPTGPVRVVDAADPHVGFAAWVVGVIGVDPLASHRSVERVDEFRHRDL